MDDLISSVYRSVADNISIPEGKGKGGDELEFVILLILVLVIMIHPYLEMCLIVSDLNHIIRLRMLLTGFSIM